MCPGTFRRLAPVALLVASAAACSRAPQGSGTERVGAGAPPASSTTAAPAPTTTVAAPASSGTDASPAPGLSAAQLREAVEAPLAQRDRATTGPVAERVTLAGGVVRWRVVVPGSFTVRDARVVVEVGGVAIGQGVLTPDLARLVAVTAEAGPLRNGAPVTFRYEGGASQPAGTLAVRR
jgi:hypothetical protein